jgi:nucleoside-diphosphate-sugar epimerase
MQTILGSGGAIGVDLAKELTTYTEKIRLVSRNPKKVNETDELFPADLTDPSQVEEAVKGSEIVYVTVGFEYKTKVWQSTWPAFIKSVIDACKKHRCKLVFFDNIYMYDPAEIPHMTEESAINPSSKKGRIRTELAKMVMDEVSNGKFQALIARSADFYGPGISNSVLQEMVFKNLKAGKAALWLINIDLKHSFTYTPDAAKATAILGNTPAAYNQVWHLPTHKESMTIRQWAELFAKELKVDPKIRTIPGFILNLMAIFSPILREFKELTYQWDREYYFDSSKFEKRFDFHPTSYSEGIKEVVKSD